MPVSSPRNIKPNTIGGGPGSSRPKMGKDDGREAECLVHVRSKAKQGNAQSVLQEIDSFARSSKWMMNVGDVKGEILKQSLQRAKPSLVLELGAYCGYSAILIASTIPKHGHVFTVEMNEEFAQITKQMAAFAGLADKITVLHGTLANENTLRALQQVIGKRTLDFCFLDHWKEAYLSDLKTLLSNQFFHEGSVVFADNCLTPGAPDYVAFMDKETAQFHTTKHMTKLEYLDDVQDMVLESILLAPSKL